MTTQSGTLPAYATTQVPVSRSQDEIRRLLRRYDADSFQFGEGRRGGQRIAGVEFACGGHKVVMLVPITDPTDEEVAAIERRARKGRGWVVPDEWAERRIWRVIAWTLRARLIAVEEGVETFEEAFLPHLVNATTGRTIYQDLAADGRVELAVGLLRQLGAGG